MFRDQPRGHPSGPAAPSDVPLVDPSTLSQKTLYELASLKYCYIATTCTGQTGAMDTQIITKPVTRPSKLRDNSICCTLRCHIIREKLCQNLELG